MNKVWRSSCVAMIGVCAQAGVGLAPAMAAQPQPVTPSPLAPIYACAEKTNTTERLACFDSAVAAVKAAEARSEIITLDQPRVAAVRREAFGFRIPSLPKFNFGSNGAATGGGDGQSTSPQEDQDEQSFQVARVSSNGSRIVIYLDNGNVWQLVEAANFNAPSKTPFNVRIRSAAMGSFILSIEGLNRGYRVRRVQ